MVEVPLSLRYVFIALVMLITLTACGGTGPTPPGGDLQEVPGQVSLPAGAGLDMASLTVVGAHGSFSVAADGKFTALLPAGVVTELAVVDAAGDLVLMALREGAAVKADSTTTARGLLFYLLGGFLLPSDAHSTLRSLIGEEPALLDLSEYVEGVLAAGGRPLAGAGGELDAALQQAWTAVIGSLEDTGSLATLLQPQQTGGSNNIVLQPGAGVQQSGSEVIHNPVGAGVAAQNHFRRPAALLAYQVGYEDANGNAHDIDPPVLTRTVDVPSTGRLELFTAIKDVLTGEAPWSPALSEGMPLTLHEGAHKTFYELVLLGPSLDVVTRPPLYDDPRFSGQRSAWNEIIANKVLDQFFDDIALPLLESLAFGGTAVFDASELRAFRSGFRAATDSRLASLGIYLKEGGSYANAVKMFLQHISENSLYRNDLFESMRNALPEATRNKLHFESMEASLTSRASASAVIAAVQLSLAVGDLAALMSDLNDALPAVSWRATAAPTLFNLSPESAYFTKAHPQVELTVGTRGTVTGTFLYRWTTSGAYGRLTDGPKTGVSLVTSYPNVWYTHNSPHNISDSQSDSVTVEVFQVESGATSIPAGAEAMARMTALLEGFDREIDSRLELQSGSTPAGYFRDGITVPCSTMYLRIPKVAGATRYNIQFTGWGGTGHEYNYNSQLFHNSTTSTTIEVSNPHGYIREFEGVCVWRTANGQFAAQPVGFTTYDVGNAYLVNVFTTMDFVPGSTIPPGYIGIGGQIRLWYDWASRGTITVTYVR